MPVCVIAVAAEPSRRRNGLAVVTIEDGHWLQGVMVDLPGVVAGKVWLKGRSGSVVRRMALRGFLLLHLVLHLLSLGRWRSAWISVFSVVARSI